MSKEVKSTGRLELGDEFWSGEAKGFTVTIHFGKIGTTGHKASREFTSPDAARDFLETRMCRKLEEGFKPA